MKRTQKHLMTTFLLFLAVALIMVICFENDFLPTGVLISEDKNAEFIAVSIIELSNIALIPMSLRLFKTKQVSLKLTTPEALLKWGLVRMLMLCIPLLADVLLYYMYMNVAFGYLAIIVFICLFFIVPTKDRCCSEINAQEQTND